MAISADLSDPLDDTKGGDALWGHWQQDKRELVVLTLDVPAGAKARNVLVVFKSSSLKVVAVGETRMDGELCAQVLPDECEWQLDDEKNGRRVLLITLRKATEGWWDRVLKQDQGIDTSRFDDVPFMLGEMKDHQHESMRDHVARMFGDGSPGSASTF